MGWTRPLRAIAARRDGLGGMQPDATSRWIARRSRAALTAAASAVLFALGGGSLPNAAQADPSPASLTGRWQNVADDDGRSAIHRAIDEAIEPMNFITEPIARGRLRDNNPPVPFLEIRRTDGEVAVQLGRSHRYEAPVGGPATQGTSPAGDDVRVRHRVRDGALVQHVHASRGKSTMVFKPSEDGSHLKVVMTIESSHLPRDVRYTLRFERSK
jgi:hypothetical protein